MFVLKVNVLQVFGVPPRHCCSRTYELRMMQRLWRSWKKPEPSSWLPQILRRWGWTLRPTTMSTEPLTTLTTQAEPAVEVQVKKVHRSLQQECSKWVNGFTPYTFWITHIPSEALIFTLFGVPIPSILSVFLWLQH